MKLLRDIAHDRGIIVLVICHDLNIASRFSDRIIMFNKGYVYADGTPDEVLTSDAIYDVYKVKAQILSVENRPYVVFHTGETENVHENLREITDEEYCP